MVRRCETADVIDHVLQLLEMQDWSDVSLNQLQVVELGNLSGTQSELKFIELLLAISSVLETMFIQTDSKKVADKGLKILTEAPSTETADVIDPVLELLKMKDWSGVSLNQLQVVQLRGLYSTQSELKFIKLLLAISPVLETMFIQTDLEKVADEGLRILNEVTRFPRLSPQAEIEFEYKEKDQV
ncbi:F-box/FBD/LRR-repeat protein [Camellia lanceoleosa]|uniref:F-box/FBD/LRR-repeat protein n=1 Tax=Camellia lanceoleosa TaxID=1840588 RepID=A0ACC0IDR6_9ERIC|nr:F-box/FBD/LRR-repeat protein [Camellia lanceoleosa]